MTEDRSVLFIPCYVDGLPYTSASVRFRAQWPARMQRLKTGPLVQAAGSCELWLDGGHNPAAGLALALV